MVTIRKDQMEAFRAASYRSFEDRMLDHLRRCFPKHVRALGDDLTRRAIGDGVSRAAPYGIVSEVDVCRFIDVMFAFGDRFDENPGLPWAREVLTRPGCSPTVRAQLLQDRAIEELGRLAGKPPGAVGRA